MTFTCKGLYLAVVWDHMFLDFKFGIFYVLGIDWTTCAFSLILFTSFKILLLLLLLFDFGVTLDESQEMTQCQRLSMTLQHAMHVLNLDPKTQFLVLKNKIA